MLAAAAALWLLLLLAFLGHVVGRPPVARVAAALFFVQLVDVGLSDLAPAAGSSPLAHAFGVCAAYVVPACVLALALALGLRTWRACARDAARRRASPA